ncbi:MAG: hypothetical protein EBX52_04305 [Proteobacteria bacterium]|nr:hypothetical protein [Pseudomonadota bacterium]
MAGFSGIFTLFIALGALGARAAEMDGEFGYVDPAASMNSTGAARDGTATDPSEERDRKFGLALDALGIPREPEPGFNGFPLPNEVNQSEVAAHLDAIDPDGGLRRYLDFKNSTVSLFKEFFTPLLPVSFIDYIYPFRNSGASSDSFQLLFKLERSARRIKQPLFVNPLEGLKIVIDPGHMGTEDWDTSTGKYVRFGGRKVSEGQIALSTSLLLANELEALGATVILTRTRNGTVAATTPETFDHRPYLNQYFYNAKDSWMSDLLKKPDAALIQSVKNAPETARAYSDTQRTQFFIGGEDLEARSKIIDRENPDIVIVIHFDANQSDQLQNSEASVEAFVPGGVRQGETGSRLMRSYHLKHLLEVNRWNQSVNLAAAMTSELARNTGLPLLSQPEFLTSIKVKDGVYARNLYLNRRNLKALTVYMECLHYDHVGEFYKLSSNFVSGSYHGSPFRYPARLDAVVSGLRDGMIRYFKEANLD